MILVDQQECQTRSQAFQLVFGEILSLHGMSTSNARPDSDPTIELKEALVDEGSLSCLGPPDLMGCFREEPRGLATIASVDLRVSQMLMDSSTSDSS